MQILTQNKWIIVCFVFSIECLKLGAQSQTIDPSRMVTIGQLSGKLDLRSITYPYHSTHISIQKAQELGLFRIVRNSSQEIIVRYTRVNEDDNQHPRFIRYRLFDSEWDLIASIITEKIDFAILESEASAREIHKSNRQIHVLSNLFPEYTVTMLAYNCRHPIFKDKAIRRALSYAIDRMGFIYRVLERRADAARGPFNSNFQAYESSLESFKYNPKKSVQLLNKQGWLDYDGDDVLEDVSGKPLKIHLIYGKGLVLDEKLVRWIKVNWNEIGVDVKPLPLKKSEIDKRLKSGRFDAVLLSHHFKGNIESIETFFSINGQQNFMRYHAREVENYIKFYHSIKDRDRRKTLLQGIQQIINRDQPVNFLYFKLLYYYCINTNRFTKYYDRNGDILPFDQWIIKNNATTKD